MPFTTAEIEEIRKCAIAGHLSGWHRTRGGKRPSFRHRLALLWGSQEGFSMHIGEKLNAALQATMEGGQATPKEGFLLTDEVVAGAKKRPGNRQWWEKKSPEEQREWVRNLQAKKAEAVQARHEQEAQKAKEPWTVPEAPATLPANDLLLTTDQVMQLLSIKRHQLLWLGKKGFLPFVRPSGAEHGKRRYSFHAVEGIKDRVEALLTAPRTRRTRTLGTPAAGASRQRHWQLIHGKLDRIIEHLEKLSR